MSLAKPNNPPESEVVRVWQQQLQNQRLLDDCEGHPVEIIYPGRLNDGQGGDFRDAVVLSANTCKSGDIEIHTRSSLWEGHGHHRNPVYNRVVLHVALEQDRPGRALLQNGQTISTIILNQYLGQHLHKAILPYPCQAVSSMPDKIADYLERAGEQRFLNKALRYQVDLAQLEEGQSLYQGVLEALGYTKNQLPFLELACRVPLYYLEKMVGANGAKEDILTRVQAILRDRASTLDWELYKVRPDNSPMRRITALSHLLYRYQTLGWLQTLMNIVRRTPAERVGKELELALIVDEGSPALLGRGRATEIIINVVLPFARSWAQKKSESALIEKVMEVYRRYPRSESNSIERHMLRQFSLKLRLVNSACRQQGLIHIYKSLCTRGKCQECRINLLKPSGLFSR